jgi:hypothetical protein
MQKALPSTDSVHIRQSMPADTIWVALASSCSGLLGVMRGALGDGIGLPGRTLAPVAAFIQSQSEARSLNPALAAIASGNAFPNLLFLASIGLVAFCEDILLRGQRHGFLEQCTLALISFAKNAARALFFADAVLQSASVAAALAGRSHALYVPLQLLTMQSTLLSALVIPFTIPIDQYNTPPGCVLQSAFACLKSFSLLRVALQLEGSGAVHMAGGVTACAAAYATRSILGLTLPRLFDSGSRYPPAFRSIYRRIDSASAVSFCYTLSVYNGRVTLFDAIALFFLLETLSPWSIAKFTTRRILDPAFNLVCSSLTWLYVSLWPAIKRHVGAAVSFLCRLSMPFTIMYNRLIAPLWRILSPLAIPSLSAYVAFHLVTTIASNPSLLQLLTCGAAASMASICAAVLYAHAAARVFRCDVDPFRFELLHWLSSKWCNCMLLPADLTPRLLRMLWYRVVMPVLRKLAPVLEVVFDVVVQVVRALCQAIAAAPVLSMACIVAANIAVLYVCYSNPVSVPILSAVGHSFSATYSAAQRALFASVLFLVRVSTAGNSMDSKDSVLAVAILALVQMSSCVYIRRALSSCKPLPPLPASATLQQQQQMTAQELQTIAESMSQPRQVLFFPPQLPPTPCCDHMTPGSALSALLAPSTTSAALI